MQSPEWEDRAKSSPIPWREVCRQMLLKHPLRRHATDEDIDRDTLSDRYRLGLLTVEEYPTIRYYSFSHPTFQQYFTACAMFGSK